MTGETKKVLSESAKWILMIVFIAGGLVAMLKANSSQINVNCEKADRNANKISGIEQKVDSIDRNVQLILNKLMREDRQ